jgi:hypothetical protein
VASSVKHEANGRAGKEAARCCTLNVLVRPNKVWVDFSIVGGAPVQNASDLMWLQQHMLTYAQGAGKAIPSYPHPLQRRHVQASISHQCADLQSQQLA